MATVAAKKTLRKRIVKQGLTILCSAFIGGSFAAESLRRRAQSDSLALNLMGLPPSHREMVSTFKTLDDAQLTPSTYLSSAESLLPHVRKLKTNISTHHILRIQAASFLKKYHNALSEILNDKADAGLNLEEYLLHQRRRISDMKLAFDFVHFNASEVSETITNIVKFNKMDYARMARDGTRLRTAFDEIYNTNKKTKENVSDEIMEELQQKQFDETRENLLEHEVMALYTHAPYLGEWDTFMKIGAALEDTYGKLENISADSNGHTDGINFNDIYRIGKEIDIVQTLPKPTQANLKFDVRPIDYIKVKYHSHRFLNDGNESATGGWFGGGTQSKGNEIELNAIKDWRVLNDDAKESIIPLGMCRLGAVQKTISVSKCVPRVQGPIFYDNRIKMRGSARLLVPSKVQGNLDTIVPTNAPLNGVNDFVEIEQIEEWDLKPVEVGNTNEFEGKVIVRRQSVNGDDDGQSFEIQYDCNLKLSSKVNDYY